MICEDFPWDKPPADWPLPAYQPGGHLHFLHLPKCAGTTVRLLAQNCFDAGSNLQFLARHHGYMSPKRFELDVQAHRTARFSAEHYGSGIFNLAPQRLSVFTWLRDPIDAALSTVYFIAQQHQLKVHRKEVKTFTLVAAAVQSASSPYEAILAVIESCRNTGIGSSFHPLQPLSFLLANPSRHPVNERTVPSAIETLRSCFFIGLVEEQIVSLQMLSRFLPLRCPSADFHVNRTHIRPVVADAFTDSERKAMRELLSHEYEIYDEGRRLWELQFRAVEAEGWLEQPEAERLARAMRRFYAAPLPRGSWSADAAAFADGFNDIEFETSPDDSSCFYWRWTSPGNRAAIRLPIDSCAGVRLVVEISTVTPVRQLKMLRMRVEGSDVMLRYDGHFGRCYRFVCIIDPGPTSEIGMDLEFLVDETFRGGPSDPRQLGIALHSISWQPMRAST